MIEARGLTKRYGDKTVVDDLSFVVRPGIVTGWSGVGAGKLCAGPTGGVNVIPPSSVLVLAWNPEASWNAVAVALTASRVTEPNPDEARVTWAIEWVECDAMTPRRSQRRRGSR